jgi:hypothetical protein
MTIYELVAAVGSKRVIRVCWVVLAVSLRGAVPASAQERPPFKLTIAGDLSPFKAGSQVFIRITQTNTSDHSVGCNAQIASSSDLSFFYDIKDSSGHRLLPRPNADMVPGSVNLCTLAPGKSTSGEYFISWLYNLSQPGKYTIEVLRRFVENGKEGIVRSNRITITVEP